MFCFPKRVTVFSAQGGVFILAEKVSSVGVAPQLIGWKVCFVGYRSIRREKQIKGFI